jgi:hypothetical protein
MSSIQKIVLAWEYLVLGLLLLLYFRLLAPFYLGRDYEVPDYFKFYVFAQDRLTAQDGFSSLFISISSYLISSYELIHWGSLCLMMGSVILISLSFMKVSVSRLQRSIFIAFVFSMGCWYYLYGKVFYEFPFIAFTFAVLLYLAKGLLAPQKNVSAQPILDVWHFYPKLFFILCGFCISWKPHALFPILGLIGIISIQNWSWISISIKKLLIGGALMAFGFFIGNYGIAVDFLGTVQGVRGYKTGTDILKFLWSDQNSTWDHTNVFSFHTAVYSLWGSFFILFVSPFFVMRTKALLILNAVLLSLFLLVAYKFLPGYPHNAFPFSLHLITVIFYVVLNVKPGSARTFFFCGISFFILLQAYKVFTQYIPLQTSWKDSTDLAIVTMEKNSPEIAKAVSKLIQGLGPDYRIDLKVKRNSPLNFYNPLEMGDPQAWTPIFQAECLGSCIPKYQIYIEPIDLYGIPNYQREDRSQGQIIEYPNYVIGVKPYDGKLIYQSFK